MIGYTMDNKYIIAGLACVGVGLALWAASSGGTKPSTQPVRPATGPGGGVDYDPASLHWEAVAMDLDTNSVALPADGVYGMSYTTNTNGPNIDANDVLQLPGTSPPDKWPSWDSGRTYVVFHTSQAVTINNYSGDWRLFKLVGTPKGSSTSVAA